MANSNILTEIFKSNKTDKFDHGYGEVYESYINKWRDEEIQLCEIGVDRGNSLRAWKEYFIKAEIIGFDLDKFPKVDGVEIHQMDQLDVTNQHQLCQSLRLNPHIIIDDGGHTPEMHQKSIIPFFKQLRSGGIYIIEDLQVCNTTQNLRNQYKVDKFNNTIQWLKGNIISPYISYEDERWLFNEIKSMDWHLNDKVVIIRKK